MANKPAVEAAAAAGNGNPPAAEDVGHALMTAVAKRAGMAAPVQETPAPAAASQAAPVDGGQIDDDGAAPEAGDGSPEAAAGDQDAGSDAGADDAAGDGGADAASPEAAAHEAETAKVVSAKLKDLAPEVQTRVQDVINKQIGRVVAKERAKSDELSTRIESLESENAELKSKAGSAPVQLPGVHPLMTAESEADIDRRLAEIDAAEDFAIRYGDGYPGTEGDPNDPPIEAADIKLRWRELQRERDRVIPMARRRLQERTAHELDLRKAHPTFFDRKSEDYGALQAKLKLMPELRRHANASVLAVQLILGERAMAAAKQKAAAPKPTPNPQRPAPRLPGSGSPAKGNATAHTSSGSALPAAMQQLSQARSTRDITKAVELAISG